MSFSLLQEDIETYVLFAAVPVYLTLIGILQSKHIKQLKKIQHPYIKKEVKQQSIERIKRLRCITPLYILTGLIVHVIIYLIFAGSVFRYGYLLSIVIFYLLFVAIMYGNFLLKGASIFKGTGDYGGLPG